MKFLVQVPMVRKLLQIAACFYEMNRNCCLHLDVCTSKQFGCFLYSALQLLISASKYAEFPEKVYGLSDSGKITDCFTMHMVSRTGYKFAELRNR